MNKITLVNRDTQSEYKSYTQSQNLIVKRELGTQKLCTNLGGHFRFTLCSLQLRYSSPCGHAHNMTTFDFVPSTS